jgi:hypothetical protein
MKRSCMTLFRALFSDHSSVDDRAASAFVSEPAFAAERVI